MKILLTGASGFLGKHLLRTLVPHHHVYCLTRNIPTDTHENITWLAQDLAQTISIENLPNKIDAIIHLAQSNHYRDFPNQATDIFDVNVRSTQQLLDYAYHIGCKKFIYSSTGSVYEPYDHACAESVTTLKPTSFYGQTKLMAENLIAAYQQHLDATVLRLFFLYGPNQTSGLIATLIQRIKQQQPIIINGNQGGLQFNPTYVEDVAAIIHQSLNRTITDTLNVAADTELSIYEMTKQLGAALNITPIYEYQSEQHNMRIAADRDLFRNYFPELTFTPLAQGIKSTIESL